MSTEIDSAVSCAACGHPMDPAMAHDTDRGSCPECGSTGIAIAIGIAEEINIAGSMRVGQGPGTTNAMPCGAGGKQTPR